MSGENLDADQLEQGEVRGPEAQAAKYAAALANNSEKGVEEAREEISDAEVKRLCAEDPELQEVMLRGASEWRKMQDSNTPPSRIIQRDDYQKEVFMAQSMQVGIRAVKFELANRGVLDTRYRRVEQAA